MLTRGEQSTIRELAKETREIAEDPIQESRRSLWKQHNRLMRVRPLVLVFPESAWKEILPYSRMTFQEEPWREVE